MRSCIAVLRKMAATGRGPRSLTAHPSYIQTNDCRRCFSASPIASGRSKKISQDIYRQCHTKSKQPSSVAEMKKDSPPPAPHETPQSLVTEAHLKAALAADKGTDAEILSWEMKDFTKKGDNYMSFVTSAQVRYKQGGSEGEVAYIAKCNPRMESGAFSEMTIGIFEKEVRFYVELVPLINAELEAAGEEPLRVAPCYFNYSESGGEVVLLGDLRKDGFKMFDRKKGMDKAHVTLVLKELARLHAASALLQDNTPEDLCVRYDFLQKEAEEMCEDPTVLDTMFESYVLTAVAIAEKIDGYERVAAWFEKMKSQIVDLYKECLKTTPPFDVVCHGDCWTNNIMFRYGEDGTPVDVRLLDLQICRKASAATDLNYFMYTSLDGSVRKDSLQSFLKTYYEAFSQVLSGVGKATTFTLEELRQEYHSQNIFGLINAIMVVPLVVSEEAIVDLSDQGGEDGVNRFMKDYHDGAVAQVGTNPILRSRLLDTFDEMIEYGVIT